MKQREVTILGQSYILGCPDGGEALLSAAVASVDREMSAIRDAGKVKARDRIAVLASLNLAFELSQMESERLRGAAGDTAPAALVTSASDPVDPAAQARMQDLIQRLDNALGNDGQLL